MVKLEQVKQHGNDLVIIAEAGVNHNGSVTLAHELIDVAAQANADYVKFQTFEPDRLVSSTAATTPYQKRQGATSQSELLRALALPISAWRELRDHATKVGLGFLSTPFDLSSAEFLVELGVEALKVPSGELTNLPFIQELSELHIPLILSTGMGSLTEVKDAMATAVEAPSLSLFHCVSAYPAPAQDCNLKAIPSLAEQFNVPVGWSDHTLGNVSAIAAAALGSRLFEKHFTLDSTMTGPDHQASLEPGELKSYIQDLRTVVQMVGDGNKRRMPSEEENAPLVRRSWHASRSLPAGHRLTPGDYEALRPETGLSPAVDLLGKTLTKAVKSNEPLRATHVE